MSFDMIKDGSTKQSDYRGFNTSTVEYNSSQNIEVVKGCNSFAALNVGDTIALVNGIPLFPSAAPATIAGDSVSIDGNEMEAFKGFMKLVFQAPVGANPRVIIVQQFYTAVS